MKTLRQSLMTALLAAGIAVNAQTNLITNGGFEQTDADGTPTDWYGDQNDWATFPKGTVTVLNYGAETPIEGTKYGHNPSVDGSSMGRAEFVRTVTGIEAGKTYKLSFWYKTGAPIYLTGGDPALLLEFYFNDGSVPTEVNPPYPGLPVFEGEWMSFESSEFTATASGYALLFIGGQNTAVSLDDVKLIDVNDLGVSDVKANTKLNIYRDNGVLYVAQKEKETIEVYNTAGQLLKKVPANIQAGTTKIEGLPRNQMLIIRSGAKTAKAIL